MDSLDWIVFVAGIVNLAVGAAIIVAGGAPDATAMGMAPTALGAAMLGTLAFNRWGR